MSLHNAAAGQLPLNLTANCHDAQDFRQITPRRHEPLQLNRRLCSRNRLLGCGGCSLPVSISQRGSHDRYPRYDPSAGSRHRRRCLCISGSAHLYCCLLRAQVKSVRSTRRNLLTFPESLHPSHEKTADSCENVCAKGVNLGRGFRRRVANGDVQ